ncbi:MAG: heavy metal translocating P-type ATPase [Candidatus Viridilinea halotolerans]|uniref:Heavy metal translocating P-type ATPase n=1 Tax=Candidatus Viridilinea halotolerans TaxID=2491704 RepID=A0A426TVS7_9CHLR|nr:MAG: heavy metal translocating P-type ATPase [Candidatus Viridilinea halotolerans]
MPLHTTLATLSRRTQRMLREVRQSVAALPTLYAESVEVLDSVGAEVRHWLRQQRTDGLALVVLPPQHVPTSAPLFGATRRMRRYMQRWGRVAYWRLWAQRHTLKMSSLAYHQWMHDNIDPLFGRERYHQLRALSGGRAENLSPVQRRANITLGWGSTAAGLSIGAVVVGIPIGPVSLAFGAAILLLLPSFQIIYKKAFAERRLSYAHVGLLYYIGVFATGNLVGAACGILFASLAYKVAALSEASFQQQMVSVFEQQPHTVWRVIDGVELETPFSEVQCGDILAFQAGQHLPVDGVVVAGAAAIDQHMLTGEAQLVDVGVGDPVLAATLLVRGRILVEVREAGAATTANQIGLLLSRSAQHRLSLEEKALKIADEALVPTLVGSSLALLLHGPISAVALIGCNYTINMAWATPVLMLKYLNQSMHMGVLVKEGDALECLAKVDTVIFDKTGTLTLEQPHVVALHPVEGEDAARVLRLAAAAEHRQTHPLAKAILAAAAEAQEVLLPVEEASYEVGYGLKVRLAGPHEAGTLVHVGSLRFMEQQALAIPPELAPLHDAAHERGAALVWVAANHAIIGALELAATVRPEAHMVIAALQQRGIECVIISGDQEAPTRHLAASLGISRFVANTLPNHKAEHVAALKAAGRTVCFVGDGINDAIALKEADVSVSLAGATTAAIDTAQVVLLDADLRQLLLLFDLVERMHGEIQQNFTANIAWSLFATGGVFLFQGGFAMTQLLYSASVASTIGLISGGGAGAATPPSHRQPSGDV